MKRQKPLWALMISILIGYFVFGLSVAPFAEEVPLIPRDVLFGNPEKASPGYPPTAP